MFRIETPRCLISTWTKRTEEREAFERWTTDPDMMRFITGAAWGEEDREKFYRRQQATLEKAGVCMGPVEFKVTGEIIGVAGVQPLELADDWHVGWWVDPAWQGGGLGAELAAAMIDFTVNVAKRDRAVAVIAPGNLASRRVAEKAGMTYEKTVRANTLETRWKDEDVVLYVSRHQRA